MKDFMNVFFFDIDGCILPCVMPVLPNDEKEQIEKVKEIKKEMKDIELYPNFIEYYHRYCMNKNSKTYFITGRKKSQFLEITKKQLSSLSINGNIIFFPEDGHYDVDFYSKWKIKEIEKIFYENVIKHKCLLFAFDDNDFYFKDLKRRVKYPIFTYKMEKNEDWDYLKSHKKFFIYFDNNGKENCDNCKRPFEERLIVCHRCSRGLHVKDYWKGE